MSISAERVRELLCYDQDTGLFTHRIGRKGRGTAAGAEAGRIRPHDGRRRIGIDGGRYFANQIAWLYVTGEWPKSYLDHANGRQDDDRFCNLRECTGTQNLANAKKPKHNTSGFKGVSWHKARGKWRATIKVGRKPIHIGHYDTADEAHAAYILKAKDIFGEYARAA